MFRIAASALLFLAFVGARLAQSGSPPAYITAKPDDLVSAYGQAHADRIFSDELTALRVRVLQSSVADIPGLSCPGELPFVLYDAYPYGTNQEAKGWIERYVVGCEPEARRGLLLYLKDGDVKFIQLAPGGTIADPGLQGDVLASASPTVLASAPANCQDGDLIDTAVIEKPNSAMAWSERWTFLTCGEIVELDIAFTPSPGGGTDMRFSAPTGN